jgi:hypothetical protein
MEFESLVTACLQFWRQNLEVSSTAAPRSRILAITTLDFWEDDTRQLLHKINEKNF